MKSAYAHQSCIYLMNHTVKTVILRNYFTIENKHFPFQNVIYLCDSKAGFFFKCYIINVANCFAVFVEIVKILFQYSLMKKRFDVGFCFTEKQLM